MKYLFLYFLIIFFLQTYGQNRVKIKSNNLIAKIVAKIKGTDEYAVTWGSTIRVSCDINRFLSDTLWVYHEMNHTIQWKKYGKFGFITKYIFYSITKGYKRNPIEIEADSPKKLLKL